MMSDNTVSVALSILLLNPPVREILQDMFLVPFDRGSKFVDP